MIGRRTSTLLVFILIVVALFSLPFAEAIRNPIWEDEDKEILFVAISTDGKYIVAADKGMMHLYDQTGNIIWNTNLPEEPRILLISPAFKYVIVGGLKRIYVFDLQNGNLLWEQRTKTEIFNIALYDEGIIVGTLLDVQIYGYDGKLKLNIYPEKYSSAGVTLGIGNGYLVDTDGEHIVVAGDKIYYYDIRGIWRWGEAYDPHPDNTIDKNFDIVKISPDGRYIIAADSSKIWILDNEGNLKKKLYVSGITRLECIPESDYFALITDRSYVYVINYNGNIKWSRYLTNKLQDLTVSKKYVSVATDKGIKIFDVFSGNIVKEYSLGNIASIDSAVEKEYLVAGGEGVFFFDFNYGTLFIKSEPEGARVYLNGRYEGNTPLKLTLDPGTYGVLITKEGYYSKDITVSLDIGETKKITLELEPHPGLSAPPSFSPDPSTPSLRRLFIEYSTIDVEGSVLAVKITPDGKYLIVGNDQGKVYKYDVNGRKIWEYDTKGSVLDIETFKDGQYIAVLSVYDANQDGTPDSGKIIALDGNGRVSWKYTPSSNELLSSITSTSTRIITGGDGTIIKLTLQGYFISKDDVGPTVPDVDSYSSYLAVSHTPWFYNSGDETYNELQVIYGGDTKYTRELKDAIVRTAISKKYVAVITGLHLEHGEWTGSGEYYLLVYSLDGQEVGKFKLDYPGFSLDMTSSGDIIVVGDLGGNIYVFNDNLELVSRFNLGSPVYSVAISEDGKQIAAGTREGKVVIFSIPGGIEIETVSGARIFLEMGEKYIDLGSAPVKGLPLSPGTYKLKIVKEYYYPKTVEVKVKNGKVTKINVSLERATGKITVTSNVDGAEVFIDGEKIGVTPLYEYEIEAGKHKVTVKASGYCDEYSEGISVNYNMTPVTVHAQLTPCPALLRINAPEGAKIYVNGDLKGTGAQQFQLSPGEYSIKVEQSGKKTYIATITLNPGESKVLNVQLETDPVYYITRISLLIAGILLSLLIFKLYKAYHFRQEYQRLLSIITSATSQNLPVEGEEIVKKLEELKEELKIAYKHRDREKLSEIGKTIKKYRDQLNEITSKYGKLKTEMMSNITSLTTEESRERNVK